MKYVFIYSLILIAFSVNAQSKNIDCKVFWTNYETAMNVKKGAKNPDFSYIIKQLNAYKACNPDDYKNADAAILDINNKILLLRDQAENLKSIAEKKTKEARQQTSNAKVYAASLTRDPFQAASLVLQLLKEPEPVNGVQIAYQIINKIIPMFIYSSHEDWVKDIAFHPQGDYLVSVSDDKTARIWSIKNNSAPIILRYNSGVERVIVSNDGKLLLTQTRDGFIHVYNWGDWNNVSSLKVFNADVGEFNRWDLNLSNDLLLAVSTFGEAVIFDINKKKEIFREGSKASPIIDIGWSKDEDFIFTIHQDGKIFMVSLLNSSPPKLIAQGPSNIQSASFSNDLSSLVVANKNTLYYYSFKEQFSNEWSFPQNDLNELQLNRTGTLLLLNSSQNTQVRLFSILNGSIKYTLEGYDPLATPAPNFKMFGSAYKSWLSRASGKTLMRFSPDESMIITLPGDYTARLWDTNNGKNIGILQTADGSINSIAFCIEKKLMATSSNDKTVRVWDSQQKIPKTINLSPDAAINSIMLDYKGENLLISSWFGVGWILNKKAYSSQTLLGRVSSKKLEGIRLASNINNLGAQIVGRYESNIYLYRYMFINHKREEIKLSLNSSEVDCASFSTKGNYLCIGLKKGRVVIYNLNSNEPPKFILLSNHSIQKISLNTSETEMLIISENNLGDKIAYLYNLQKKTTLEAKLGKVTLGDMTFTKYGAKIIAFLKDTVQVWNLDFNKKIKFVTLGIQKSNSGVRLAKISPDGKYVGTSTENEIIIWGINTRLKIIIPNHRSRVVSLKFSHNSNLLLSASWDKTARVYNIQKEKTITVLEVPNSPLKDAIFSPDEKEIIIATDDGNVSSWPIQWYVLLNYLNSIPSLRVARNDQN